MSNAAELPRDTVDATDRFSATGNVDLCRLCVCVGGGGVSLPDLPKHCPAMVLQHGLSPGVAAGRTCKMQKRERHWHA